MPDTLLMSEDCFLDLVKQNKIFDEKNKLADFLCLWLDLGKFVNEIFNCLQESSPQDWDLPTKTQRKSILNTA